MMIPHQYLILKAIIEGNLSILLGFLPGKFYLQEFKYTLRL